MARPASVAVCIVDLNAECTNVARCAGMNLSAFTTLRLVRLKFFEADKNGNAISTLYGSRRFVIKSGLAMSSMTYANDHFVIKPCLNCPIAGYLIVSPIVPACSLSQLRREVLESLGATLAMVTRAIEKVIQPERVYCALFAEETRSVHFHLFPRSRWLLSKYATANPMDREISGPRLLEWARNTFHSPVQTDYDQLNQAVFRELTSNGVALPRSGSR